MTDFREHLRMGIDLGGTKIEGVVLDATGVIVARERIPTPRSYITTLEALVALVHTLDSRVAGRATIGLGIPGTIVPETGRVKNANSTWLIGEPLQADLEARLERGVRVENDANCFALSEATDGAGADGRVVFGVIMGTGVGGGVVIDRTCLVGRNRIGGEWGHNPLPWPTADELEGTLCYCGQRGCIETWFSGTGIAADHTRRTGQVRDAADLMQAALTGDADAAHTRSLVVHRAARSLATIVNVIDPDVIVLGGGVSNSPGLAEEIQTLLPRWVFSDTVTTPVRRHVHGDSSGVRGAAWLWPSLSHSISTESV
ncbi:MAG: ROK family protein [Gemmatimonadaceae bacterium]|nr:ROK family protein [Gemmatimonadaceae bacterium]